MIPIDFYFRCKIDRFFRNLKTSKQCNNEWNEELEVKKLTIHGDDTVNKIQE